jgi:hypothetical protein
MGFTTKKYRVSVIFCHKLALLVEPKTDTFGFWAEIYFFKPVKIYIYDNYI